jgi:hypothetical protein
VRQAGLHGQEHAGHVGVQHLREPGRGGLAQWRLPADTGVGEHDVQAAEPLGGLVDRGAQRGLVRGVGRQRDGVRAESLQRRGQGRLVAADDRDPGALRREQSRGGQADATVAAGDQGGLVSQFHDTDARPLSFKVQLSDV